MPRTHGAAKRACARGQARSSAVGPHQGVADIAQQLTEFAQDSSAKSEVRRKALWALGGLEVKGVARPVAWVLRTEPDPSVREQAARSLGQMGSRFALQPLVAAMTADNASTCSLVPP